MSLKIAVVYSHHKLGDLIWQLPYLKSISKNFSLPITLITRPKTQAKDILKDNHYIQKVFYCEFRKKLWYFVEIFNLYRFFKKEKFSHIFILDKISRPAIAAKLADIKNIIGPGIKNQKKWLTNKNFLNKNEEKEWEGYRKNFNVGHTYDHKFYFIKKSDFNIDKWWLGWTEQDVN